MTAIIVIVVVALVFFVTIGMITFMVWKRETQMKTDSMKAIESTLEKLRVALEKHASARAEADAGTAWREDKTTEREREAKTKTETKLQPDIQDVPDVQNEASIQLPDDPNDQVLDQEDEELFALFEKTKNLYEQEEAPEEYGEKRPGPAPDPFNWAKEEEPKQAAVVSTPEYDHLFIRPETSAGLEPQRIPQQDGEPGRLPEQPWDSEAFTFNPTPPQGMPTPQKPRASTGHNIGRSGRRYTAEELETLIKE